MAAIVNLRDLEPLAEAALEPAAWAYYSGGAGDEVTLQDNDEAWARRRLRPRVLVDVSHVDTSTTLLGERVALPVGIAPTALHGLCCDEAEAATAAAAADAGVLYTMSSLSSLAMEDVAAATGPRWFQLYAHRDRAVAADMVARAGAAGFTALVLTADLPVLGRRDREQRAGYEWGEVPVYGNFRFYAEQGNEAVRTGLHDFQVTWDDLGWLAERSDLPIVIKGVMTGEDASLACEHGAAAVWVSNHGARQLDRTPATVDVLEECASAVAGRAEVYVDGGIRRGTDVLVARALGADAVFLGRPWLYALAVGGADGIRHAASLLRDELVTAMALLGTANLADVTRAHLR